MGSNFKNVEQEHQHTVNYLKDMFGSTFDEDVIESVLLERNWNVDRAIDDLMTMTAGNAFEIPIEDMEIDNTDLVSNQRFPDQFSGCNDTKTNYDDDGIVILDEEEYVVRTESDDSESVTGENYQPQVRPPVQPTTSLPTVSYASMAQKPASENAVRAAKEHTERARPPYLIFQGYTSYDRIKRARDSMERVKLYVQNRFKIMVILRGCPGSGKSTLAKNILEQCNVKNNPFMHIHSTDNFFCLNERGVYQFDEQNLSRAHHWNVANVLNVVREGLTPVIVDNTNTQIWEMEQYASMAVCAGYEIEVIEPPTPWVFNINQLVSRTSHKVPRDKLYIMLDRYDHHVSATTLLKHFHLKYSPEQLPPQNGVRTINDSALISTFDRIYRTLRVWRENVPECVTDTAPLTKAQRKREKKKLRKMIEEEAAAAAAFVELDDLTSTDSANSVNDTENDVTAGEEEDEIRDESDSDPNWLTVDEDELTEGSRASEDEQEEENEVSSADSDEPSESMKNDVNDTEKVSVAEDLSIQETLHEESTMIDEELGGIIPVVVDKLTNPVDIIDGDELITLSASVIDVETSGSRLKCFEKLRVDGKKEEEEEDMKSCIDQAAAKNVHGFIKDGGIKEDLVVNTKFTNPVLKNVQMSDITEMDPERSQSSNNSSVTSESVSKFTDCLSGSELVISKNSDDNPNFNASFITTETPSPLEMYVDCSFKPIDKPAGDIQSAHNVSDPEMSPKKNDRTPDVADNNYNTKNRKLKQCNIEGQKNTSLDTADAPSSYKFKDDSTRNVIANDLWGKVNENENDAENNTAVDVEKEFSDDNSDNVESRSNSSSSDEIAITDVHNTSNRFVNNDIKNEQNERKKPNINHKNSNQNVADDVAENLWNTAESAIPELNTLKERILISSMDKVLNQNPNIEFPTESTGAISATMAADVKQTKLPQRLPTATTSFHIIENKLRDEHREECSTSSSRSEDFEDAIDSSESRLLNQWMRSENWVEDSQDVPETKKTDSDIKPQRKVRDSPSKQKNRETAPNIRLVNDIRNVSDNSKMSLLLDKKNKNQDSAAQPLKSTNFQSQFWLGRSSPHSLNTMQHVSSKEDDIELDFEAKSKSFHVPDDHSFDTPRNNLFNRTYPGPFKNFDVSDSQYWSGTSDSATAVWGITTAESSAQYSQMNNEGSPELLDSLIARHRNIASDDNSSDFEKSILKWSPFNETTNNKTGETVPAAQANNSYFVPMEIMNQEMNKATNTGLDENAGAAIIKIGRCREINQGRSSPERSVIESSYKCDKSTMADVSAYTLKAKPLKEDLANIFPLELVDVILDLYDKCNGNMDWMIEILMEDGHSPSDDQLEYLSSLQNMVEYEMWQEKSTREKIEKDKKVSDKKKNKGKHSKNGRGGSNSQMGKKVQETCPSATDFNDHNSGEGTDVGPEEHVDLFFDWSTVSQLLEYFGNPTIHSIGDYQPTVKLPISLARQLHAYLIGSIIDQAEENEDLINLLSEEDSSINNFIQNSNAEELSQKDITEVEKSMSDFLQDPCLDFSGKDNVEGAEGSSVNVVRHKDSFASKLSLNLLLKAFPTLDSSFVKSTFKAQNFNYYDTKNVLNQYGKEVPIDAPRDSPPNEHDSFENNDDIQFFGNNSNVTNTRSDVLQQVTEYRKNASVKLRQWQKCHESLRTAVQEKKFGVAAYYRDCMNVFRQKYEEDHAHAASVLINSCYLQNSGMIDLHYFKVTEALEALDKFLDENLNRLLVSGRSRTTLYIITGRGARSVNGVSRIQPSVKNRLKRRNISCEVESYNTGLVKAIIRRNSLMSNSL